MSQYQKATTEDNQGNGVEMSSTSPPSYSQANSECVIQQQPNMYQPASAPPAVPDGWMPVPQHIPNNTPDGLQCLMAVNQLNVIQKVHLLESFISFEKNNKYTVLNNAGQIMFHAVEDTDCCTRNCCGSSRPFEMKILDDQDREIIHLSRPYACDSCLCPCCLQKIEVYSPPGNLVGIVEQNWSLFAPIFTIRNAVNEAMLKIKGPICPISMCGSDVKFKVLSKDKTIEVGHISKKWSGFVKEMFTDADNFSISFPMDLDVHMKAVMLGACFLIDFMYFEKSSNK